MERDSLKALLRATGGAIERGDVFYLGDPSLASTIDDTANLALIVKIHVQIFLEERITTFVIL